MILAYHRVAHPEDSTVGDPWKLRVRPERFAAHMEIVAEWACAVRLTEFSDALRGGSPGRRLAITFDDGYQDNLTHALPVLEHRGLPATVFFVAGVLGKSYWWDRLARLLSTVDPRRPFRLSPVCGNIAWKGSSDIRRLSSSLHRVLRVLPPDAQEAALAELAAAWGTTLDPTCPRAMDEAEAELLVRSGLVEPGAHTVHHPPLAEIEESRAMAEIVDSRRLLEERFDRRITSFAYPHGSGSRTTVNLVREAGFCIACLRWRGSVRARSDPMRVPRIWVEDWTAEEFRRRVGRHLAARRVDRGSIPCLE